MCPPFYRNRNDQLQEAEKGSIALPGFLLLAQYKSWWFLEVKGKTSYMGASGVLICSTVYQYAAHRVTGKQRETLSVDIAKPLRGDQLS